MFALIWSYCLIIVLYPIVLNTTIFIVLYCHHGHHEEALSSQAMGTENRLDTEPG